MDALNGIAGLLAVFIKSRASLVAENLALRQQLAVLTRSVKRPRLRRRDRLFWAWLSPILARLEDRACHRQTRNGHPLVPSRVPTLLALEIEDQERPTEGRRRDSTAHPSHVPRKSDLGSTKNPL